MHYMSCSVDKYSHLIDSNVSDHLRQQSFTGGRTVSWATETELAAAVEWYNINILVSRDRQFNDWIRFTGDTDESGFPSMRLLLENSHFSLVLSTMHTETSQNPLLTKSLQPVWDWIELPAQDTEDAHIDSNAKGLENQHSGPSLVNSAERVNRHHRENHQKSMKRSKTSSIRNKGDEKKLEKNTSATVSSVTNLSQHKLTGPQVSLLEKRTQFYSKQV